MNDIQKQISKIDTDIDYHKDIVRVHNRFVNELLIKKSKLERALKTNNVMISEHAILQYLMRVGTPKINPDVLKIDIDKLKADIISDHKEDIAVRGGNCTITHQGIKFVVKNYVIVTIIDINK